MKRIHIVSLRYFTTGVRNTDKTAEISLTDQCKFTKRLKNEKVYKPRILKTNKLTVF
jgi:ribosomal protein S30